MKLKGVELLVLLVLLSKARTQGGGRWVAPPGEEPLPIIPLPPNPLQK